MLTNRLGLPQAIVDAVKNDPYTRGMSDISVTQLITPPYQRQLRERTEVVEDAADRIWSLVGQVGHSIVERAYPIAYVEQAGAMTPAEAWKHFGVVAERRLYMPVNGWTVSGQFDVIEGDCLQDFKFTSAWAVMGDTKEEWEWQLNFLRLLAIHAGIETHRLRIVAVLRDWSKMKAKIDRSYPQAQVVPLDIEVWPLELAQARMLERVKLHQSAGPLPCTDRERWKSEDVYAVMKEGRKSAVKLHDTHSAAAEHAIELGKSHTVVKRPGEYRRCMDYCNVAHACPTYTGEVPF